jgi:16S rRNA (cytidine1402-2'-O)-methyltransferase
VNALYVVASPIGNLEDLSPRAARVLREVDVVAAEDTRAVAPLLAAAGRSKGRVVSLFEGNEAQRAGEIVELLRGGESVAIVSEGGMPVVSDPGARVVAAAIASGARIEVIPGPSAMLAALVASGLPAERFTFVGFPPRDAGARHQLLGTLRGETATMIFYEAPDRVGATLGDLAAAFGERAACLSREITKLHEEHVRGTLAELAGKYATTPPRGECTIVVEGAAVAPPAFDVEAGLRELLAAGLGPRDAAARLVIATGKPRRELYQLALALMRER